MFKAVDIIEKKKNGGTLARIEIEWFINHYVHGGVKDYQMAALLMAVFFKGMTAVETADMTAAMLASGGRLEFDSSAGPVIDKHSTGGVGDKVSIILAPLAASLGIKVPMLSGRSLGHTGGTLDKLEAVPGFKSLLTIEEMAAMMRSVGCFISGQTEDMVPADKMIYALRDVTATVDCVSLITSSILSKKLAEGLQSLVMDIKFGSGAFMKTLPRAQSLAATLTVVGKKLGLEVRTIFSSMDEPLGCTVGNAVEIIEAVKVLRGQGPEDLRRLVIALCGEMVLAAGISSSQFSAETLSEEALLSGKAIDKFKQWITAQKGQLDYTRDDLGLRIAPISVPVCAGSSGFIHAVDAAEVGILVTDLGGGRRVKESAIDHGVGVILKKKIGEKVFKGEIIAEIAGNNKSSLERAVSRLQDAVQIGRNKPRIVKKIIYPGE